MMVSIQKKGKGEKKRRQDAASAIWKYFRCRVCGKWIFLAAVFFVLIFCFCRSASNLAALKQETRGIIVYEEEPEQYTGAYAAEKQEDNAEQNEKLNFTFWGCCGAADITGVDLGRISSCHILAVCGNTQNLYPNAPALLVGDTTTCLISSQAAQELFGDCNVTGLRVRYRDTDYTIAGVFEQNLPVFVYETSSETVTGMNHVSVENGQAGYLTEPYRKFQSRYGEGTAYDYGLLTGLLKGMLALSVFFVLFWPEREAVRNYRVGNGRRKYMWLLTAVGMAVAAAALFIFVFDVSVDMFPAVWSDFDAWREFAERIVSKNRMLFCDTKEPFMFRPWSAFAKGTAWSAGCYICLGILKNRLRCGVWRAD